VKTKTIFKLILNLTYCQTAAGWLFGIIILFAEAEFLFAKAMLLSV
jgi:hypothetical protein